MEASKKLERNLPEKLQEALQHDVLKRLPLGHFSVRSPPAASRVAVPFPERKEYDRESNHLFETV